MGKAARRLIAGRVRPSQSGNSPRRSVVKGGHRAQAARLPRPTVTACGQQQHDRTERRKSARARAGQGPPPTPPLKTMVGRRSMRSAPPRRPIARTRRRREPGSSGRRHSVKGLHGEALRRGPHGRTARGQKSAARIRCHVPSVCHRTKSPGSRANTARTTAASTGGDQCQPAGTAMPSRSTHRWPGSGGKGSPRTITRPSSATANCQRSSRTWAPRSHSLPAVDASSAERMPSRDARIAPGPSGMPAGPSRQGPAGGSPRASHLRKRCPRSAGKPALGKPVCHRLELAVGKHMEPLRTGHRRQPPVKLLVQRGAAEPDLIRPSQTSMPATCRRRPTADRSALPRQIAQGRAGPRQEMARPRGPGLSCRGLQLLPQLH